MHKSLIFGLSGEGKNVMTPTLPLVTTSRISPLYVITPDGTTVASRVHAAVLICVKTAAILGAVLALGPLKEEDYMYQLPLVR